MPAPVSAVSRFLRALATTALVVMIGVTSLDIAMRLVLNELVLGSVEIVQLVLVATVFFALPETFLRNEHITVDVVDAWISRKALGRLERAADVVTAAFLCVLAWRVVPPALDTLEIGDLTSDLQLSLFWYWIPIVVGAALAAVVMLLRVAGREKPPAGHADEP